MILYYRTIHGINSDLEAKLPKILKNGSVSQSQWLLSKGKKFTKKIVVKAVFDLFHVCTTLYLAEP